MWQSDGRGGGNRLVRMVCVGGAGLVNYTVHALQELVCKVQTHTPSMVYSYSWCGGQRNNYAVCKAAMEARVIQKLYTSVCMAVRSMLYIPHSSKPRSFLVGKEVDESQFHHKPKVEAIL